MVVVYLLVSFELFFGSYYLTFIVKEMEDLLLHLWDEWVGSSTNHLARALVKGKPLPLTSRLQLTPPDLQTIQFLLIKNYVQYSSAHLTIQLRLHNILFYQRMHKLVHFAQQHLNKPFQGLLQAYMEGEMLPVENKEW